MCQQLNSVCENLNKFLRVNQAIQTIYKVPFPFLFLIRETDALTYTVRTDGRIILYSTREREF